MFIVCLKSVSVKGGVLMCFVFVVFCFKVLGSLLFFVGLFV